MNQSAIPPANPQSVSPRPHRFVRRLCWLYAGAVLLVVLLLSAHLLPAVVLPGVQSLAGEAIGGGSTAIALPALLLALTGLSAALALTSGRYRGLLSRFDAGFAARQGQALIVPVGAALPMTAGSAAQVLLAWEEGERMHRGLRGAKFTATTLAGVRRRGWASSAAERELGVASVSAPVRGAGGKVLAAISVSGPIERLTRSPGRLHAAAVVAAGEKISELLRADSGHRS